MIQIYLISSFIPYTRTESFKQFLREGQPQTIKGLVILELMNSYPEPLTCYELSRRLRKERNTLTFPLKDLERSDVLTCSDIKFNSNTKRDNSAYALAPGVYQSLKNHTS